MSELYFKFEPRDCWIGVYWELRRSIESPYKDLRVYICLIPMFPLCLRFEWGYRR